jgi:hypothetical protein
VILATVAARPGCESVEVAANRGLALQAAAMAEDLPQRDGGRFGKWIQRQQARAVTFERRIEIELARFDLLHDSERVEEFGNAADAKDRIALRFAVSGACTTF